MLKGIDMEIKEFKVTDLKEYERNPRYNYEAVEAVKESIKEFGFKVPIVIDKNNVIVAGHTRLKAAKMLGMSEIPCIVADDLTDEQVRAFRLADNKVSELASWDFELLQDELLQIENIDMELFGFETEEENEFESDNTSDKSGEESNYRIAYELVFNDEYERDEWYEFLKETKQKFGDCETISQRVLRAIREWRNG